MNFKLVIKFRPTNSKALPEVLRACRNFPDFADNTVTINSIRELFGRWSDFSVIIWHVVKLSGTFVYINDTPVLPLNNDLFYLLQDLRRCYTNRNNAEYCRHGWGCRRLHSVTRYISESWHGAPLWYRFGRFDGPNKWVMDKRSILRQLKEESGLNYCQYCPEFKLKTIQQNILNLPNEITVGDDWLVEYRLDYLQDGTVRIPVNILHKADSNYEQAAKSGLLEREITPPEIKKSDPVKESDIDSYLDVSGNYKPHADTHLLYQRIFPSEYPQLPVIKKLNGNPIIKSNKTGNIKIIVNLRNTLFTFFLCSMK